MMILAIDPGTEESGWVTFDGKAVIDSGVLPNEEILDMLTEQRPSILTTRPEYRPVLAIEMIASYGMPVGRETFETCVWIGRFIERWQGEYKLVYRKDVKSFLCGSMKAKDGNVRQALIDRIGPQGKKSAPGPTYGVKSHAWSALAVAVTAHG